MNAPLAGQQSPEPKDLLTGIQEFRSEVQRSELKLVFHHWIERIQSVLDNNGEYFHESTVYGYHSFQFCPIGPWPRLIDPLSCGEKQHRPKW
jgi:hypothetical protein